MNPIGTQWHTLAQQLASGGQCSHQSHHLLPACNALELSFSLNFSESMWWLDNCGINQCGKPIVRAEEGLLSEILRLEVQGRHCLNYSFPETIEVGNRRGNTMRL